MTEPVYRSLAESFRLDIYIPRSGLIAPPSVMYAAGERPPQSIIMRADASLNALNASGQAIYALDWCMRTIKGKAVPVIRFETEEAGQAVATYARENHIGDLTLCVPYEKRDLLPPVRKLLPLSRGMLDMRECALPDALETAAGCHESDATMTLVSGAAREWIRSLRKRFVQVWVEAEDAAEAVSSGACGVLTQKPEELYDLLGRFPETSATIPTLLFAHKTDHVTGECPENSTAGSVLAGKKGYDAAEIDVKLTKDDVMVVHHDRDTKNLFTENFIVHEADWERLKDIRRKAFPEYGLDRMEDLMVRMADYPETPVLIEIKTPADTYGVEEMVRQMKGLLARENVQKGCTLIMGAMPPYLSYVHEQLPYLPVAHCTRVREEEATDSMDENNLRIYRFALETRGANAGYNPYHPMIGREFARLAHVRGMTVFPWTWAFEPWEACKEAITDSYLQGHDGLTSDWIGKFYGVPVDVRISLPDRWPAGKRLTVKAEILTRGGEWIAAEGQLEIVSPDGGVSVDEQGGVVSESGVKRLMAGYRAALPEGRSICVFSECVKVIFE